MISLMAFTVLSTPPVLTRCSGDTLVKVAKVYLTQINYLFILCKWIDDDHDSISENSFNTCRITHSDKNVLQYNSHNYYLISKSASPSHPAGFLT